MRLILAFSLALLTLLLPACALEEIEPDTLNPTPTQERLITGNAEVVRVIDGDTIEVRVDGVIYDVRYIGVNTPERDEPCYAEATAFNRALVEGQTVRLEMDTSNLDPFDRLLRYIYVGNVFVNEALVREGYAEAVVYPPDDREYDRFVDLENAAAAASRGCHPTGIFDDDNPRR